MSSSDATLNALREALKLSPDNLPLRLHLAQSLLNLGHAEEAEREFRAAIQQSPQNADVKVGLATAFSHQGKNSEAMVIVEDLIKATDCPAAANVLYARLLVKAGDVERAVRQYKRGIEKDPASADVELAARLGINARPEESDVVDGKVRATWDGGDTDAPAEVERPTIRFKDVGGMEALKEEIRLKIIHPLEHADLYKAYGKAIGGGILMYGPPGCGKTHLARATAGEIDAGFIAVGISDVLDMWIGNSEKNLNALFEQARRAKPCVLFFDEVDALAASRADMRTSGGRHLINQFLSELDGVKSNNDGVLVLAATNAPWHVDPAFRRPGRFDRILFVPPPDAPARAGILRILLAGKPVQDVDHDAVAKRTAEFSGADLKAVVDQTIEAKLREAMKAGLPKPITTKDLLAAVPLVKPSTREWFSAARNYALYSNQGGTYDDILKYMKT
ncbi:MAG TPA: AAA family ATPase [Tepidisphaeraceae bacterium]|jgi:SpoVK/Ycf46/Vps4 family AAA+-type ATPase|nr:AAA family ATPase [Tepidisphaeraceae bacterium]